MARTFVTHRTARFALVLGLLVPSIAARAQTWLGAPGTTGTQVAEVGDAKLKLPPGQWDLLSERGQGSNSHNGIDWRSKLYLQVLDGKVAAIVVVGSNESAPSGHRARWLVPTQCGLKASATLVVDARNVDTYGGTYDCLAIAFIKPPTDAHDPLTGPLLQRAAVLGGLPDAMLFATFARTNGSLQNSIDVEIYVNPGTPGFVAAMRAAGIAGTVTAANALTAMTSWAGAYRDIVGRAMP
jgi:hypothetical protein